MRAFEKSRAIPPEVHKFTLEALFSTLTNVNFDPQRFYAFLRKSQEIKAELEALAGETSGPIPAATLYVLPEDELEI